MKHLSHACLLLAVLLSDGMCAVVAFQYARLLDGLAAGYSAPPETAFLYAIPFGAGIALCLTAALLLRCRSRRPAPPKP